MLKLEQTLAQWPLWRCEPALTQAPRIVRTLGAGSSNYSVLIEAPRRFVVRIDGINPATNGLNRQSEWRVLHSASLAGLAPRPCYFNPDLGSLVCEYLEPDAAPAPGVADVGALLSAIHQLPARHHRLDLRERIQRYEKLLLNKAGTETLLSCHPPVSAMLATASESQQATVLCHHDLLQSNRIYSGGRLWAIDWEYAAMGSPWYDLAVVIQGDALDAAATENMLCAYLDRSPSAQEYHLLHLYACVYAYLELLWYLALDNPALSAAALTQKQAALMEMLQRGSK